jgi:transglutaminase-like putative cysteine protease
MASAFAGEREYRVGPAPGWIEHIAADDKAVIPKEQVSDGVYYLLTDIQTRVEARDQTQYRHYATKALNENGVEDVSHIAISFDPAYQTLTLHSVQVRRGGKVIPKLSGATVRVLEREKELEYRIFDGRKSVNLFLNDVRVGDVVEYAFSLRGTNPVFANHRFGRFDLQWSVPVQRIHARLLWPAGREVYFARHNTELQAGTRDQGGYREYRWDVARATALVVEDGAPGWYDPYPWVQWSEFKDWAAVAQWAVPLYKTPEQPSAALKAEIERIARATSDPEQRMLAALRFVQGEIRYLGVEIGPGSHAPTNPDLVLQRRFGDCKDKSLLTVTLLRAFGIEAQPALVNTNSRRGIRDWLATPTAFDHAIVHARLNGQDYWIDPTRSPQKGNLTTLFQPDYSYALVVDPATRDLTPMARKNPNVINRTIHAVIDMREGIEKPARYTVTTVYEGGSAEAQRQFIASENREELQKKFLNFYARYYPGITTGAPFAVREDERVNRLTMTEQYVIPDFWKHAEAKKRREASIYVPDMAEYVRHPSQTIRRAPLALRHPLDVAETTDVLLPSAWKIEPERTTVDDPAFEFERRIEYAAKEHRVTFKDRFRSRLDYVAPADVARYVANLDRVDDNLGYSLYQYDDAPPAPAPTRWIDKFNWPIAMLGVLILLLWAWLASRLYRYDPLPRPEPVYAKLQGIRGWLVLPAISVVVQPFRIMYDVGVLVPSFATDVWTTLTTAGGTAYDALWAPILLYELAANLALLVFAVLLAVLFFQRRRSVPVIFVAFLIGAALVQGLDLWLASLIPMDSMKVTPKEMSELARSVVGAMIWSAYFLVSHRVKSTFVHGCPSAKTATAMQPAPS